MAERELTIAEEIFVAEYIANGFVATEAYRVAYPNANAKTVSGEAHRIPKRPAVRKAIMDAMKEHLGDIDELAAKALIKLEQMAFAQKGDEYYNPSAQLRAIELIQKQLGLQTQNIKAQVDSKTTVEINIMGDTLEEDDVDEDQS